MSLPVLWKIREALPEAHLAVASSGWCGDIYRQCSAINEVLELPSNGKLFEELKFSNFVRSQNFDSAVILPNSFHSALVPLLAGIKLRFGYQTDGRGFLLSDAAYKPKAKKHTVLYYQELLEILGIDWPSGSEKFDLEITEAVTKETVTILAAHGVSQYKTLVGFSPGAAWGPSKRWPSENFKEALSLITSVEGRHALLFGSPGDKKLTASIREGSEKSSSDLAGAFDNLHHLVAAIKMCDLLVTNDSGPMHIAAAVGTPVLVFFGPTDENISGPWVGNSGKSIILRPENCSPCYNPECRKETGYCLGNITPAQCRDAAESLLAAFSQQGV